MRSTRFGRVPRRRVSAQAVVNHPWLSCATSAKLPGNKFQLAHLAQEKKWFLSGKSHFETLTKQRMNTIGFPRNNQLLSYVRMIWGSKYKDEGTGASCVFPDLICHLATVLLFRAEWERSLDEPIGANMPLS